MDNNSNRRYGTTINSTNNSTSQLMRPSSTSLVHNNGPNNGGGSFIPTVASVSAATGVLQQSHLHHNHQLHQHHGHNHTQQGQNHHHSSSKLAQQLALQSQLQAQSHSHVQVQLPSVNTNSTMHHHNSLHHHHHQQNHIHQQQQSQMKTNNNNNVANNAQNHYYQNLPNRSAGLTSRNSMPNHLGMTAAGGSSSGGVIDHHHHQQMLHSRSSAHIQLQNNSNHNQNANYIMTQQHYGNTIHNNNNNNNHANILQQQNNGNFYGTLTQQHQQQSTKGIPIIMPINGSNNNNNNPPPPPLPNNNTIPSNLPTILIQQIQQQHLSTQITQQIQQQPSSEILQDGGQLPQTLVESMRTLFDILDDSKQGKVRLSDIESRWENHSSNTNENGPINGLKGNTGAEPLIKMGVLGYLRKVTPSDGLLTFDRFCAGLKLALLTNNPTASHYGQQQSQYGITMNHAGNNSVIEQHMQHSSSNYAQQRPQQQTTVGRSLQAPKTVAIQQQMNGAISLQKNQSSKIPGITASRLPTVNNNGSNASGIPISPTARYGSSNVMYQNAIIKRSTVSNSQSNPGTNSSGEQGTTIALVHQPPPAPNPKPTSKLKSTIEAMVGHSDKSATTSSFGKNKHNYMTKNGSLDNLKSDEPIIENNLGNNVNAKGKPMKDRPPSAPILDLDDGDNGESNNRNRTGHANIQRNASVEFYSSTNTNNNSNSGNNTNNNNRNNSNINSRLHKSNNNVANTKKSKSGGDSNGLSIGKRVVNFVTPRQRTLSMPQLQFNKLKSTSKSINLDDNSPTSSNSTSSPSTASSNSPAATANAISTGDEATSTTPAKQLSSIPTPQATKSLSSSKLSYLSSKSQLIPPSFILSKQKSNDGLLEQQHRANNNNANINSSKESALDSPNDSNNSSIYPPAPPKPPRNNNNLMPNGNLLLNNSQVGTGNISDPGILANGGSTCSSTTGSTATPTKPEIRNVLQTWQKGIITGTTVNPEKKTLTLSKSVGVISTNAKINSNHNNGSTLLSSSEEILNELNSNTTSPNEADLMKPRNNNDKKSSQRRRETPRRHTVQSGIDFTTLKRLKQLEQERDVLQQGVSYIEATKDWYSKQLEMVEEKIELLTKGVPTSDYWSESHEERLNLLGCRVSEVNSLLTALMDGSSCLPLNSMNLQIPTHLNLKTITRLKDQNRQLTQEVSDCSHRVTQLETEKAMLLRQLFHQKTTNNLHNSDETVYM